jgi:hypothetical protein
MGAKQYQRLWDPMTTEGPNLGRTKRALLAFVVVGVAMSVFLSACGGGQSQSTAAKSVSVFDLRPQDCLNPPKANPNLAVSSVKVLPCTEPHVDEVYCVLPYNPSPPTSVQQCPDRPPRFAGSLTEDYPGEQALTNYANAVCLNQFQSYVGSAYTGSSLYYTYLFPSPRSWDDSLKRDREIVCILHTIGAPLKRSAKGSKL